MVDVVLRQKIILIMLVKSNRKFYSDYVIPITRTKKLLAFIIRNIIQRKIIGDGLFEERFPVGAYNKLSPMNYGPFHIVRKLGTNMYLPELRLCVRLVFNVAYLYHYYGVGQTLSVSDIHCTLI